MGRHAVPVATAMPFFVFAFALGTIAWRPVEDPPATGGSLTELVTTHGGPKRDVVCPIRAPDFRFEYYFTTTSCSKCSQSDVWETEMKTIFRAEVCRADPSCACGAFGEQREGLCACVPSKMPPEMDGKALFAMKLKKQQDCTPDMCYQRFVEIHETQNHEKRAPSASKFENAVRERSAPRTMSNDAVKHCEACEGENADPILGCRNVDYGLSEVAKQFCSKLTFDHKENKCTLPTDFDLVGYNIAGCNTDSGAIAVSDCTLTCTPTHHGAPTATCSTDGDTFVLSGCQAKKCAVAVDDLDGYDISNCNTDSENIAASDCTLTCTPTHHGVPTATCSIDGEAFVLNGCQAATAALKKSFKALRKAKLEIGEVTEEDKESGVLTERGFGEVMPSCGVLKFRKTGTMLEEESKELLSGPMLETMVAEMTSAAGKDAHYIFCLHVSTTEKWDEDREPNDRGHLHVLWDQLTDGIFAMDTADNRIAERTLIRRGRLHYEDIEDLAGRIIFKAYTPNDIKLPPACGDDYKRLTAPVPCPKE